MRIVIDIGEHNKNVIDRFVNGEGFEVLPTPIVDDVIRAVRNGKSLPKGHGRLIDADWVLNKMNNADADTLPRTSNEYYAWSFAQSLLTQTPTIIEADKENENADSN